jgi:Transposase, Mutator family
MYPVVFFDALRVKIRDDAVVRNKAIYLALGVLPDGSRDVLGLWIEQTEGAKFWLKVFNDLKTRGCKGAFASTPAARMSCRPSSTRAPAQTPSAQSLQARRAARARRQASIRRPRARSD